MMGKRNIIRISLAALLLILLPAVSKAQTVITGKVSPNEAVIVTAKSHPDGKILGYVMTDNDGKYRLEITSKADSIDLTVSGMDIASQTKTVRNESQACDFVLVEKAIRLKEVTVKAKKITLRHDTINYSVASYAETQDKTVKEVMKKIPGLKVYSTGQIQYNGKWVKDLYIEGMDALGSNYGIAINNINAKDVASIQVMENHQGIKALENKQLGSAPAINLKLKESAKASWNSNVDLAAGGKPFAWDAEANLMRFSKNMQNISFIKSNDIGENLSTELGFDMSGEYRPVDILLPSSPSGLDESAYYINRSASASTNQLHKINADAQISYGINYLYDMEDKDNSAISKYYISGDSTMNVAEDNAATIKRQSVYASVNYKLNSGKHYIQDKINFRYQDYAGNASTQNNDIALSQSYGDKAIDASNSFIMINTTQKKVYTINSLSSFKSEPISLSFGDGSGSETTQNFYRRKFTTQNTLPVFSSYILPYTRFDMPAVLNLSYNSIESRTKDPLETDSNSSQLQYSLLASPSILF
ncbi:MAG: hypothetical protein LKK19_01995, partial [Bacteroidales bacterium]|nr:hypothetical protein [Bacteroidales bacterium]